MGLGIYMAMSQNHVQHVTHAHTLLLGFVVSLLYAVVYRLWLVDSPARMAMVQTFLHEFGTTVIVIGLFLLFSGAVPEPTLGPLLGAGSFSALAGALLMFYQVVRVGQPARLPAVDAIAPRQI